MQTLTVRGRSEPPLRRTDRRGAVFDAAPITDLGGFVLAPFAIFGQRPLRHAQRRGRPPGVPGFDHCTKSRERPQLDALEV